MSDTTSTPTPAAKRKHDQSTNGSASQPRKKIQRGPGRRRNTRPEGLEAQGGEGGNGEKQERLPKRSTALLIGFAGTGYFGMQMYGFSCDKVPSLIETRQNTGVKTIEGTVFDALVKAGAISKDNSDDPVKVQISICLRCLGAHVFVQVNWQRSARTDAGVHAAGNVVSLRMITAIPGVDDLKGHINSLLPPEIRLWGYVGLVSLFETQEIY
jgi:tRNA pseudouridine38-40 synthase